MSPTSGSDTSPPRTIVSMYPADARSTVSDSALFASASRASIVDSTKRRFTGSSAL